MSKQILMSGTLADGSVIWLERHDGKYTVELGVEIGVTVPHAITGEPVQVTNGCIWCDKYGDKAYEAYDLIMRCDTLKIAECVGRRWWSENMDILINGHLM